MRKRSCACLWTEWYTRTPKRDKRTKRDGFFWWTVPPLKMTRPCGHLGPPWSTAGGIERATPSSQHTSFFQRRPATQYRQKGNFFYLSTEPYKYGFKETTWNFFEASHGKRAPDSVGGALKRTADRIVAHPDAHSLYEKLRSLDTSVKLFFVPERDTESKTEVKAIIHYPILPWFQVPVPPLPSRLQTAFVKSNIFMCCC